MRRALWPSNGRVKFCLQDPTRQVTSLEGIREKNMRIRTAGRVLDLMLRLILLDPKSIPFALHWIQSLRVGHTALGDHRPAITFKALAWLNAYLKPEMEVFEYGTGGSTLLFAQRVKRLISVEHECEWWAKLAQVLADAGIKNCELVLRKPDTLLSINATTNLPGSYISTHSQYRNFCFEEYVKTIDCYDDNSFDLVLVDGRSRSSCVLHAMSKIKVGGYLMLDNSERPEYEDAKALLTSCERRDFFGIGPYSDRFWQTSVWRIIR